MKHIYGDFIEDFSQKIESLELIFRLNQLSLKERWKNNYIVAQFLSDYFSTFLSSQGEQVLEVKQTIHYIANELLENALKFNDHQQYQVKFNLYLVAEERKMVLTVSNSITKPSFTKLEPLIKKLLCTDTQDLYIKQIEASTQENNTSGLGLLTIINDYSAQLAWKIEQLASNRDLLIITTMAQIVTNKL